MPDDIKKRPLLGRFPEKDHDCKWFFLQTRSVFEAIDAGNSDLHRMVEYAYLICNNHPGGPTVVKSAVKTKEELNA